MQVTRTLPWQPGSCEPLDLIGRVAAVTGDVPVGTVIDWGCGLNHSPISVQVKQIACETLISVDAWPQYIAKVMSESDYRAANHYGVNCDILDYAERMIKEERRAHLSLCLDIVEHLEYLDAIRFLRCVEAVSSDVLIWIPLGNAPIDHDTYGGDNHELHRHRSTWDKDKLEFMGYAVEVLPDFHTPMFGWKVDGGWAVKHINH